MQQNKLNFLIFGFGNPARCDDALGILLADNLQEWALQNKIPGILTDTNYQLNIEDSYAMQFADVVIFADATVDPRIENFSMERVKPSAKITFSLHTTSPAYLLHMCNELYHKNPVTYILQIRGYQWELKDGLSPKASKNLKEATKYLRERIEVTIKKK